MTLDNINVGTKGKIKSIGGGGALRRRLLDMGLTPRTEVKVIRVAPLGDPMVLSLRGYELTLRKEDASHIQLDEHL